MQTAAWRLLWQGSRGTVAQLAIGTATTPPPNGRTYDLLIFLIPGRFPSSLRKKMPMMMGWARRPTTMTAAASAL